MKISLSAFLVFIITITSLGFWGCSATGWSSKDIPDGSKIDIGKTITITEKDGTVLTGECVCVQDVPMPDYVDYYNSAIVHSTLDRLLPQIGETIQFTTRVADNKVWEGEFLGFDSKNISVKLNETSGPEEFYISSLNALSMSKGKTLEAMQFRRFYENGEIPLRSAIVLRNGTGDITIPINKVEKIVIQSDAVNSISSDLERY